MNLGKERAGGTRIKGMCILTADKEGNICVVISWHTAVHGVEKREELDTTEQLNNNIADSHSSTAEANTIL